MADAKIIVEVQGKGVNVVKRDLDSLSNSGEKATSRLGSLKTALIAIGGAAIVRSIINVSDRYTDLSNKLRVATGGQEEFNAALISVKQIARDTFTPLEAVANAYSRFELATKDLGKSQQEVADFTKAVAQTFRVSGSNAQEASNAMVQLGQALASGRLSGDEFRSVSEANSKLLTILAENLGVARGELKNMAADGLLTADVLFDALLPALDGLNKEAEAIEPTVAKSFQLLIDKALVAAGESQALGAVMAGLSGVIIVVADNFDVLIEAVTGAILGIGTGLAAAAIPAAIAGFGTMTTVISGATLAMIGLNGAMIGVTGLIGILAAVGAAAYIFRDELSATVIFIVNEAADAVDNLIVRLQNLATQATTGLSATLAAVQNLTGMLSDEDYERKLISLGNEQTQVIKDSNEALKERIQLRDAELQRSLQALGGGSTPATTPTQAVTGATAIQGTTSAVKEATKAISAANDNSNDLLDTLKDIQVETDRFSNSAADTFAQFATGAMSAKDALRSLIQDFISMTSRSLFGGGASGIGGALTGALGSLFGGGGFGGAANSIGQSIGSIFSSSPIGPYQIPGFANGGSMVIGGNAGVDQNLLSLNGSPVAKVGRGETLSVTPNGGMQGVTVNQTINVSTGVQQTVRAELARFLPVIEQSTTKAVEDARLRGATA